jgi:hypothetical protein
MVDGDAWNLDIKLGVFDRLPDWENAADVSFGLSHPIKVASPVEATLSLI